MHKLTKATSIPRSVKDAVWERDMHRCILCGSHQGAPVAHVIRRSRGGMGIERNIVTLCPHCHREFDEGRNREAYEVRIIAYLKGFYPDWNRADMIYRKEDFYAE